MNTIKVTLFDLEATLMKRETWAVQSITMLSVVGLSNKEAKQAIEIYTMFLDLVNFYLRELE